MSYPPGEPPVPGWTPPAEPPPGWQQPPPGPPGWQQPGPQPGPLGWQQPPGQFPPGWGPWQAAPKPGVIPLRPMAVGEILDGAFTTIRRYPRATLGLSAIVASFGAVVQLLLTLSLRDTTADGSFDGGALAAAAAGAIISILAGLVLTGMLTIVISEAVLGRPISLGAVWSRVTPRIGGILGAAILVSIVLAIGLVLCVLPGVYLYAGLAFTTPVLILEGASITAAMRRSRSLVNGSWWRVFGILVLASLIASVVGGVISVPFIGLSGGAKLFQVGAEPIHLGTGQLVLQAIGQIVSRTITAPITAGVTVLLYIDRRMRSEGLDVALAQAAAPPPASRGW